MLHLSSQRRRRREYEQIAFTAAHSPHFIANPSARISPSHLVGFPGSPEGQTGGRVWTLTTLPSAGQPPGAPASGRHATVVLKCFEHLESSQRVGVKALNSKVPTWELAFLAVAGARCVLDPGSLSNSCSDRLPFCASTGHLCTAGSWFSGLSSMYGLFPGAAGS